MTKDILFIRISLKEGEQLVKDTYEKLSSFVNENGVTNTNIKFLLDEVSKYPELYNAIANDLWVQFGIRSAEITLLVTYMIHKYVEG